MFKEIDWLPTLSVALTVYPIPHLPIFHFRFIFPFFSFFFSVVSLSWRAFSIQCKMGWQEWNQACYKLTKDFKPFSNASSICRQSGAELVSIASLQENKFVYNVSEGEDIFIGLRAAKANDSFVWSDGSTFDYSRWEDGEPNGDCVVDGCCVILVEPTGRWNDTPCEMWHPFVCKFTSSQPKLRPGSWLVFNRGGTSPCVVGLSTLDTNSQKQRTELWQIKSPNVVLIGPILKKIEPF